MLGGLSIKKERDSTVDNILSFLKSDIELKISKELAVLEADSYKTQVVAGINFFIKAKISNKEFIFVKVFRDLPHNNQNDKLISVKVGVLKDAEIVYF